MRPSSWFSGLSGNEWPGRDSLESKTLPLLEVATFRFKSY